MAGLAIEINAEADAFQELSSKDASSDDNIHLRHLRMENIQIMFWDKVLPGTKSQLQFEGEMTSLDEDSPGRLTRMRASLLVTFSLPVQDVRPTAGESDDYTQKRQLKPAHKSKILSSGYQLIGSIIRCDWSHLDATIIKLQQQALLARGVKISDMIGESRVSSKTSFFPDSLNVQELYDRISGAGKHLGHGRYENNALGCDETNTSTATSSTLTSNIGNNQMGLLDLPEDIVATSIATYLRAHSLHSLRATNRKMYKSLRGVVPGLKLKLFHHQIRSLEWMEIRERKCTMEEDLFRRQDNSSVSSVSAGESVCGGDYHRAVTGGATVLLSSKGDEGSALRFHSESGNIIPMFSNNETQKATRCARGGLLCDDPGLGKTITVISLILRTFGLSTEPNASQDQMEELIDEKLFNAYWYSEFLTEHIRMPAILKLVTRLIKSDKEAGWFVPPIDNFIEDCPDYHDVIPNPISLQEIRHKYSKSDCRDFRAFESDVRLCFTNAMAYNPPHHQVYQAAQRLSKNFDSILADFKADQIKIASKSITRMTNDPSARSLVDLYQAKKRADVKEQLATSSSTLLVVPNPLLTHWQEQLLLHVDFGYISSNDSLPVYYHTSKRNIDRSNSNTTFDLKKVTHPLIFVDDGSKELPPSSVLARFPIVVTSYNRFTNEWGKGSVEQELRASNKSGVYWGEDTPEASPLLKVSWLRVIVDEGHVMGKNANNMIQFASWLAAERHWAMTGTPTQQVASQNGLRNLYFLANYVRHEFFNQRLGREKTWNELISHPWKVGNVASFFRLKHITSYLMVRHTKADLIELPFPIYSTTLISLSQSEITAYNTIVSGIRTNLITTSMEGKTSGKQDSLLNARQSQHATKALENLRIACCGGAQLLPKILNHHWAETLEMLRDIHNLDDVKVQIVNNFIYRAQAGEVSSCHCCGIQLQTLFVIPCGHLVCTECIDNTTKSCPVCDTSFDVDDFQRLQPGLELQFCLNLKEEQEEREKQYALKRAFAETRSHGGMDVDDSQGVAAEGNRSLVAQFRRKHKRGESCVYSSRLLDGKCTICRAEHFDCNFMVNNERKCRICFKSAEDCPDYNRKAKYVIGKLLELRNNDFVDVGSQQCNISPMAARFFSKRGSGKSLHRPLKAIVFSQFRAVYEYFGDRLIRRFGGGCIADFSYGGTRSQELQKFIHDPECFVMLLSKQGSVGLDLSFVTHIFFLDTIYDKSLEAQVVARAYRMGATGPVCVEQLTAKNSIEEVMNQMNAGIEVVQSEADIDIQDKHAKVHTLLKSAKLLRPQEHKAKRRKLGAHQQEDQPAKRGGVRFK